MARDGGGRPTVESARSIDMRDLTQLGILDKPGETFVVPMTWSHNACITAEATFELSVGDGEAQLRVRGVDLHHWTGITTVAAGQVIDLVARPVHFGGRRWFFVCPLQGDLALRLHLPLGARGFASRQAHRLGYACQRESQRDQAFRRARKARHRLGGGDNLSVPLPRKPKWMRWATYWRLRRAADHALGIVNEDSLVFVRRLQDRLSLAVSPAGLARANGCRGALACHSQSAVRGHPVVTKT